MIICYILAFIVILVGEVISTKYIAEDNRWGQYNFGFVIGLFSMSFMALA